MRDDLATFGKQMGIINGMDPLFPRQDQSNLPIGNYSLQANGGYNWTDGNIDSFILHLKEKRLIISGHFVNIFLFYIYNVE